MKAMIPAFFESRGKTDEESLSHNMTSELTGQGQSQSAIGGQGTHIFHLGAENNIKEKKKPGIPWRLSGNTSKKTLALFELFPLQCCIKNLLTTFCPPYFQGKDKMAFG